MCPFFWQKLAPDFSLFSLVREMRGQRIAMVQTRDQYVLVHRAVKELFLEQLKIIHSNPYANVDIYGLPLTCKDDQDTVESEPVYELVQFPSTSQMQPTCEDNARSTITPICGETSVTISVTPCGDQEEPNSPTSLKTSETPETEDKKLKLDEKGTSLGRKSSLHGRFRAMFDKGGGHKLSRAKSDISTKFLGNLASKFANRNKNLNAESSGSDSSISQPLETPQKRPTLKKKPNKIPRSKSLKVKNTAPNPEEPSEEPHLPLIPNSCDSKISSVTTNGNRGSKVDTVNPRLKSTLLSAQERRNSADKVASASKIYSEPLNPTSQLESSISNSKLTRSASHVWTPSEDVEKNRIFSSDPHMDEQKDKDISVKVSSAVIRRRVPKTNPHFNPSPGKWVNTNNNSPLWSHNSLNTCSPAQANSSDSSMSNTPSSLPSTPTHSIDRLSSQRRPSPLGLPVINNSTPTGRIRPPRPNSGGIVKGSLSSTPSESDERIDNIVSNPTGVKFRAPLRHILGPQGRGRSNSFRQAVIKEAPPAASTILAAPNPTRGRGVRDYEPIWPEESSSLSNGTLQTPLTPGIDNDKGPLRFKVRTWEQSRGDSFDGIRQESPREPSWKPPVPVENTSQMSMASRVHEIQSMLEELKAPAVKRSHTTIGTSNSSLRTRDGPPRSPRLGTTVRKHQRSLRTAEKPLSCFTLQRAPSFESLSSTSAVQDSLKGRGMTTQCTGNANQSPPYARPEKSVSPPGMNENPQEPTGLPRRPSNDYVSLQSCRAANNCLGNGDRAQQEENCNRLPSFQSHRVHPENNGVMGRSIFYDDQEGWDQRPGSQPVPPPRAKRQNGIGNRRPVLRSEESPTYESIDRMDTHISRRSSAGTWSDVVSRQDAHRSNSCTLPAGASLDNDVPVPSVSPKAIIRALNLFQTTAANVRSKLSQAVNRNRGEFSSRSGSEPAVPVSNSSFHVPPDLVMPQQNSSFSGICASSVFLHFSKSSSVSLVLTNYNFKDFFHTQADSTRLET